MIGECVLAAATLSTSLLSPQWESAVDRAIKFWERREISIERVESGGDISVTKRALEPDQLGVAYLVSRRIELTNKPKGLSKRQRTLIVAHEIGHVIGHHGHHDDPNNLMFPTLLGGSKVDPMPRCEDK